MVLADGGMCIIDDLNLMKAADQGSLHEALEQQTFSIAKVGLVCQLYTRCALIASANPANVSSKKTADPTNLGFETPILSRFDLVFVLEDEYDPEFVERVADHLLYLSSSHRHQSDVYRKEELWTTERLRAHFASIRDIRPNITHEAQKLLDAYYRSCHKDPRRNITNTTNRLRGCLKRLSIAHARLLHRNRKTLTDALMVIRLIESSHGFGRITKPLNPIKHEFPLTANSFEISEIFRRLNIQENNESLVDCEV